MELPKTRNEHLTEIITIRVPERLKSKVDELKTNGVNCQEWIRNLIEKNLSKIKSKQN
jgi:hypothetical protein